MTRIVLTGLALLVAMPAFALPGPDECEQNPWEPIPICAPEEDPPLPPLPPIPPDPNSPPAITPVAQLTSVSAVLAEMEMLVDWYLTRVLETLGATDTSIAALEPHLQAFADANAVAEPSYYANIPAENRILDVKIRILTANHAEFADGASLPADFVALLERADELDIQERGLAEASL